MIAMIIVLGVLVLLCLLPVAIRASYDDTGARLRLLIGPLSLMLFPRQPKRSEKTKERRSEKKANESEKESAEKKPLGGKLPQFRQLLALVQEALGYVRRKLLLKDMTIHLTVGGQGEDPADAAVTYGRAWAAVGVLIPTLENTFRIRKRDVQVNIDFNSPETVIYADGSIALRMGDILWALIFYGIRGFKLILRHKKKGGKKHGTSNQ